MTFDSLRGLSQRAHWAGGDNLISRLMAEALARPDMVSLAAGFVDQATVPVEATREAIEALWSDPARARAALQYGTTIGHLPLREAILARLSAADGAAVGRKPTLDQIVMTAGSNQLLHLVADTLLDAGDIVLCAAPSYFVFLATLTNVGARTIGVATDEEGIVPEALEEELSRRAAAGELARIKAIYVVSYYDNPMGVTPSLVRRQRLLEIARQWSREGTIYVIEDAAYRELRYYGEDVPSLLALDGEDERVIHAGTFSKPYSPGIRVGWGILPRRLVEPVIAQKGNVDFGSPHFNQVLMATAMELGLFERHVAAIREKLSSQVGRHAGCCRGGAQAAGRRLDSTVGRALCLDEAAGIDRYGRGGPLVPPGGGRRHALRAGRVLLSPGGLSSAPQHAAAQFRRAVDRRNPPGN